eukprot:COSAG06_NODE_530_length_14570_cov_23.269435_16_plen_108_part_00
MDGGAAQHAQRAQLRRVTPRGTAATAAAVTVCTRRRRYLALPLLLLLLLLLLCLADLSCRARLPREQPARRLAPCRKRPFPQLLLRLPRASLGICLSSSIEMVLLVF